MRARQRVYGQFALQELPCALLLSLILSLLPLSLLVLLSLLSLLLLLLLLSAAEAGRRDPFSLVPFLWHRHMQLYYSMLCYVIVYILWYIIVYCVDIYIYIIYYYNPLMSSCWMISGIFQHDISGWY